MYALIPRMIVRGSGEFAAVASLTGLVYPRKMAGYGASKSAVINYLASLRYELEGTGVRLSCAFPETVCTPMTTDFFVDPGERARAERSAITPERVVRALENGLARKRFLVVPGAVSKVFWRAERFAPALTRAIQGFDKLDFV